MPYSKSVFEKLKNSLNRAYLNSSTITSATILSTGYVDVTRSIKLAQLGTSSTISTIYNLEKEANDKTRFVNTGFSSSVDSSIQASAYSPDRKQKAVIRKLEGENDFVLEIYESNFLISHQLKISAKHRAICTNPFLVAQGICWSENGKRIMYLAEASQKKVDIWQELGEDFKDEEVGSLFEAHGYKHHWGEAAFDFYNLEMFVYDLETKRLGKPSKIDKKIKITSAQFADRQGHSVVFCGVLDDGEGISGT
jgi:hypothetical protein